MAISGDVFKLNGYSDQLWLGNIRTPQKSMTYWMNGVTTGSTTVTTTERFQHNIDLSGCSVRGGMPLSTYLGNMFYNSTDQWQIGGLISGSTDSSNISRLTFLNDSGGVVKSSFLVGARQCPYGFSSSDSGYSAAGVQSGPTTFSTVDKILFANDNATPLVRGILAQGRFEGVSPYTRSDAWNVAGSNGSVSLSTVDRVNFATDGSTAVAKANYPSNTSSHRTAWNQVFAYCINGSGPSTAVNRLSYVSDMVAVIARNFTIIAHQRGYAATCNTDGWVGGNQASPVTDTTIERMTFGTDTVNFTQRGLTSAALAVRSF